MKRVDSVDFETETKRTERNKQVVMRESTKVTKNQKRESTIIHGRPQKFFQGCKVNMLFLIFKLLTISVPSKIILHWPNICFSERYYFRAELVGLSMYCKHCELYNKYTVQSYEHTNKITFHPNSFLFACFSIALKCCKCARMRFHCATVLVVLSICAP